MYNIDESNREKHEYPTYGRQFNTYKWFKPIILAAVMGILYGLFAIVLLFTLMGDAESHGLSYTDLNFTDMRTTCYVLGTIVVAIPALFIATKIVRDRPFSSYTSARGGWNLKIFGVGLLVAAVTTFLPSLYLTAKSAGLKPKNEITAVALLVVLVLGSLQCIAEEYVFRGVLMQTIGSWVKIPVIAVLLQAAIFAFQHKYDVYGLLSVLISGVGFGLVAWITRGIEASCALHIMNNVPTFYFIGAGLASVSGKANTITVIYNLCTYGVFVLVMLVLKKKTHLFDEVKRDDLAQWNEKHNS